MGYQAFKEPLQTRLHQRAAAIERWADANRDWGRWWRAPDHGRATLTVYWESAPGARAKSHVRVEEVPAPPGGVAQVYVWVFDHGTNYDGLTDPEAVTLKFVSGVDALLRGVAIRFTRPHPDPLPRTRREREWLAAGNQPPVGGGFLAGPLEDTRSEVQALPEADFWEIMNSLSGDVARRERRLRGQLRKLRLPQIAAFHVSYVQATRELYTRELWDVAEEAIGWASDDVFTDLRCWVVAQGRETYDAVRADPAGLRQALMDLDEEVMAAAESLGNEADQLYAARAGRSMPGD